MRKVCIYFLFTSACSIFWKTCVWTHCLRPLPCLRAQNRRAVTALRQGPKDWMNLFCCPEGATPGSSEPRTKTRFFVIIARATFAFVVLFCVFLWQHCGATYKPWHTYCSVLGDFVRTNTFSWNSAVWTRQKMKHQCFFKLHPKHLRSFWDYSLDLCAKSLYDRKTYWIIKCVCVLVFIFKSETPSFFKALHLPACIELSPKFPSHSDCPWKLQCLRLLIHFCASACFAKVESWF